MGFGDGFMSDIITVIVGPGKRQFNVPSQHLQQYNFFAKVINGELKEKASKIIELPEEDPGVFKAFLHWLYRGLPNIENQFKSSSFVSWVKFLIMADKLCLETLAVNIAKHVANLLNEELHINGKRRLELFHKGFQMVSKLPFRYLFIDAILSPENNIWPAQIFQLFANDSEFFVAYARYSAFVVEAQKVKLPKITTLDFFGDHRPSALLLPLLFESLALPSHLLSWADRHDASANRREYFRDFLKM